MKKDISKKCHIIRNLFLHFTINVLFKVHFNMYNKENKSDHRAISGFPESPFCSMDSLSRK
jgi:hypothetical protein